MLSRLNVIRYPLGADSGTGTDSGTGIDSGTGTDSGICNYSNYVIM